MARVLSFLIRYISNYYTLHRSDLAARAVPLDPRLEFVSFIESPSNIVQSQKALLVYCNLEKYIAVFQGMSGFGITEFFHIHQFNKTLQLMLGPFTEKYAEPIRDLTYRMRLPMVRYFRIINQSGVLIFHEKSVCSFVPNLLSYPIRFPSFSAYSRIWQDTLGLKRFFKDGRQSPDWCMLFVSKWFLRHLLDVVTMYDALPRRLLLI